MDNGMNYVSWNSSRKDEFRDEYNKAKKENVDMFTFKGNKYVLDYAKYLLEYLDIKLK